MVLLPCPAGTNTTAQELAECVGKLGTTGITSLEGKKWSQVPKLYAFFVQDFRTSRLFNPSSPSVREAIISSPAFYPYLLAGDSTW